ncbi:MAG TPA: hypothetical protein VGM84_11820 [Steroidobacteraceae bacterium]|jgi:hypothetical protein
MTEVSRRSRNGASPALRTLLSSILGALALLAIGCGNGGNQNGTPVVTVSSTNTHFVSFGIAISSIQINKDDGTIYNLLGVEEAADLARVDRLTELLDSPAIPNGTYTSATISFDYSTAQIYADVNGQSVFVSPVDTSGTVLTSAAITVNFDKNKPLIINSGQSVRLELSFNLPASVSNLDTSVSPATAQLYPVVTASLTPINSNPIRAKGSYLTADVKAGTFIINGRPFYDLQDSLGALNITTTSATTYDINGTTYSGSTGLDALSKQPLNQYVYVVGTLTDLGKITPGITATQVYVGNSVEGIDNTTAHMSGTVSARSGNTFTLKGITLVAIGATVFEDSATLTVGSGTKITADGRAGALTADAISVGEFIEGVGASDTDSTGTIITLDTTAGEVRVSSSRLWGTLNSATAGNINLNLLSINGYEPSTSFNFAGTGSATANDATPANYYVNAPSTDLSAAALNSLIRIDGDANAFGSIASPTSAAFTATNVTTADNTDVVLEIEWSPPGTAAPFSVSSSSGIVPNLTGTSVHAIQAGPTSLDLTTLATPPTIVPSSDATNFSAGGGTSFVTNVYSSVSDLLTGVNAAIAGTSPFTTPFAVRKLVAVGRYNAGSNVFSASRIDVVNY